MKTFNQYFRFLALFFGFCFSGLGTAQEEANHTIKLHSIMLSPLGVYDGDNGRPGGLTIAGDVTASINKHLIVLGVNTGASLGIFSEGDSYADVNIRYGRAFILTSFLETELHAGVGYFRYNHSSGGTSLFNTLSIAPLKVSQQSSSGLQQTIGFPLVTKIKLRTGPRFTLGLYGSYNINSAVNLFSMGLMFEWNFIKDKN